MPTEQYENRTKLIAALKLEMAYTETVRNCENCGNRVEIANSHVDRMWDQMCNLHYETLKLRIPIAMTGSCRVWKARPANVNAKRPTE